MEPPNKKLKASLKSQQEARTTITVLVGRDNVKFSVPKRQICNESQFFKAACKKSWLVDHETVVRLINEEPNLFRIFVSWVNTKDTKKAEDLVNVSAQGTSYTGWRRFDMLGQQLAQLFFLGSVLQAPNFQNAIMDLLISKAQSHFEQGLGLLGHTIVELVYRNTDLVNSPLRLYILDEILADCKTAQIPDIIPRAGSNWGHQFITQLMQYTLHTLRNFEGEHQMARPWDRDLCRYHFHPNRPEGYSCTEVVVLMSDSE